MDKRLKYNSAHHKSPRGKQRQDNFRYPKQQYFQLHTLLGKVYKEKNKQMGLRQTKKHLHSLKKKNQHNGKGTNFMGKHICQ